MNLLATPLQLVMIYPFLKARRLIFFNEKQIFPDVSVQSFFSIENWISLCFLFESVIGGIIVWAFTSIITFPLVFLLFEKLSIKEKYGYTAKNGASV
jgi:Fe2+ transport system protein B